MFRNTVLIIFFQNKVWPFSWTYRNWTKQTCHLYIVYILTIFTPYLITNITSVVTMDLLEIVIYNLKKKQNNK